MNRTSLRSRRGFRLVLTLLAVCSVVGGALSATASASESTHDAGTGRSAPWAPSKAGIAGTDHGAGGPSIANPLLGGSFGPQVTDDELPGVPLPALPVMGALGPDDPSDVYSWDLTAGQTVTFLLDGAGGTDFDLYLYAPDRSVVATSLSDNFYPEAVFYRVPDDAAGTYSIEVYRYSGVGQYTLKYAADNDSELPGTAMLFPSQPISGQLDWDTDALDVFNVYLWAGQTFSATLNGAPGTDFDLFLFPPGTVQFWRGDATILADTFTSPNYPDPISYTATTSGTYYLVARAWSDEGSGWYNLSYSRPLREGTFRPSLTVSASKARVGRRLSFWGSVAPKEFSHNGKVLVQKRVKGRWVQSRWLELDKDGKFPRQYASYGRPTTQTIRLFAPEYVDPVAGVIYHAAYSKSRTMRWY